jgi:hypothetical protein
MQRVLERLKRPAIAAGLTLLAAPYVGMLWEWIAPSPTYVNLSGEVYLDNQDSSEFIAADGWFLILGLLVGIFSAVLAYWRWRGDLAVILALAAAAIPAAVIAREVGEAFGPASIQKTALSLANGATIHGSITVAADGVLFAWSVGILLTYLSLVGGLERSQDEDPDPAQDADPEQDWEQLTWEQNGTSVRAAGLAGDIGAGQRGQVGEHDPLPAEQGELGP